MTASAARGSRSTWTGWVKTPFCFAGWNPTSVWPRPPCGRSENTGCRVVADAVGSRNPANREVALSRLGSAGAEITSTEMLIYELLQKAGTDEFRATLPLVK